MDVTNVLEARGMRPVPSEYSAGIAVRFGLPEHAVRHVKAVEGGGDAQFETTDAAEQ